MDICPTATAWKKRLPDKSFVETVGEGKLKESELLRGKILEC
jgi:hypothetical protein